jgi:hypothetical protein
MSWNFTEFPAAIVLLLLILPSMETWPSPTFSDCVWIQSIMFTGENHSMKWWNLSWNFINFRISWTFMNILIKNVMKLHGISSSNCVVTVDSSRPWRLYLVLHSQAVFEYRSIMSTAGPGKVRAKRARKGTVRAEPAKKGKLRAKPVLN